MGLQVLESILVFVGGLFLSFFILLVLREYWTRFRQTGEDEIFRQFSRLLVGLVIFILMEISTVLWDTFLHDQFPIKVRLVTILADMYICGTAAWRLFVIQLRMHMKIIHAVQEVQAAARPAHTPARTVRSS
jgi:hypothetical protein